ncbi:DUF2590 family protein [Vibrio parahaemolyticus]|nr:DUF2590 family protein [Vibrio parahaemolyticus]MDN4711602.1 DUF2590 family protein [Vibrio parahaemolyticus]
MPDKQYIDIQVIDGGWDIDSGEQPTQCSDLYSIAQDIKHAILESGLARELLAERNPILRADVLLRVEHKAELDTRIIPGSASATESEAGSITLTAQAYGYEEQIETEVSA